MNMRNRAFLLEYEKSTRSEAKLALTKACIFSAAYRRRDIKTFGELYIVDETFSFLMLCSVRSSQNETSVKKINKV